MTFMEAEAKLAEIAAGRFHNLGYELTTYAAKNGGGRSINVRVYIDGVGGSGFCKTWNDAFVQLKKIIEGSITDDSPTEELPGEVPEPVEEGFNDTQSIAKEGV